jgi:hypothetical protein
VDRVVRRFYRRGEILRDSSEKGVEILRVLALSIRPEQDYDEEFRRATQDITVGALKRSASNNDVFDAIHSYRPPYSKQSGFEQLGLREALNKIALRVTNYAQIQKWWEVVMSAYHKSKPSFPCSESF